MKLQRLAPAVLFTFVAGLASTAAGEVLHPSTGTDEVHHSEGSTCPDPDSEENPCGPSCPCTCCPGHLTAAAITVVPPFIEAQLTDELETSMRDDLHPKNILSRVFHPPRA